ncbi:PREDICTED: centrosomal protein of 290 kDa-like isoform X2 [Priapulus caudatus]|uniref:Centrosomal protein of 290 kDa-like isoform X2 n=1 Tax=Priapulus caudatus TaxID=37621 RepID=A0ABM1DQZ2_PRICU|nr:PREDICTED: centrosomal protein of 290 kDa-like isoform X2 [Priapulus caudatus]
MSRKSGKDQELDLSLTGSSISLVSDFGGRGSSTSSSCSNVTPLQRPSSNPMRSGRIGSRVLVQKSKSQPHVNIPLVEIDRRRRSTGVTNKCSPKKLSPRNRTGSVSKIRKASPERNLTSKPTKPYKPTVIPLKSTAGPRRGNKVSHNLHADLIGLAEGGVIKDDVSCGSSIAHQGNCWDSSRSITVSPPANGSPSTRDFNDDSLSDVANGFWTTWDDLNSKLDALADTLSSEDNVRNASGNPLELVDNVSAGGALLKHVTQCDDGLYSDGVLAMKSSSPNRQHGDKITDDAIKQSHENLRNLLTRKREAKEKEREEEQANNQNRLEQNKEKSQRMAHETKKKQSEYQRKKQMEEAEEAKRKAEEELDFLVQSGKVSRLASGKSQENPQKGRVPPNRVESGDCIASSEGARTHKSRPVSQQDAYTRSGLVPGHASYEVMNRDSRNITAENVGDFTTGSDRGTSTIRRDHITAEVDQDVAAKRSDHITAKDGHHITGMDGDVTTPKNTRDITGGSGSVTATDRYDVTATDRDNVTATDRYDVTAADHDNVTATNRDDVTAADRDDVTAMDRDDVIAMDHDDVIATDRDDVIATDRDDVTAAKTRDCTEIGGGGVAAEASKFDDILATLRELEKEADLGELSRINGAMEKSEHRVPLEDSYAGKSGASTPSVNKLLTEDKLRNIMHFLDEVERTDDETISQLNQNDGADGEGLESAAIAASEVTHTVLQQKLQLQDKQRSVQALHKALQQQRELTVRHAKDADREMKQRLHLQKEEYEAAIRRHLGFIDQLIGDKKMLAEKCEQVVKELKSVEKKYIDKIRQMQESHMLELQKVKEMHAAAEKLRREKWITEKTKKIKEMTVRGLEPEIQRLIARHKAEVKRLDAVHAAELLAAEEKASQRFVQQVEELREQCAREKEAACAHEREFARQRYEKQVEQEEEAYQQQRRHLYAEVQAEKDRQAEQALRQQEEIEKLQRGIEESSRYVIDRLKEEFDKDKMEWSVKHNAEVAQLRERLAVEKEAWQENHAKKQELLLAGRQQELGERMRRERDRAIETVIERLERDSTAGREESEKAMQNRIKRIRDKYESEMKELEIIERDTVEKYNHMKGRLTEVEGENATLVAHLKQKEKAKEEMQKELSQLTAERERMRDVVRQEFADRIVATEEESRRGKQELAEARARGRHELERTRAEASEAVRAKEAEMEEVHKRVKQAIVKKEETLSQIRQQYQAAVRRADHLEGLLDQQRKQLLGIAK